MLIKSMDDIVSAQKSKLLLSLYYCYYSVSWLIYLIVNTHSVLKGPVISYSFFISSG